MVLGCLLCLLYVKHGAESSGPRRGGRLITRPAKPRLLHSKLVVSWHKNRQMWDCKRSYKQELFFILLNHRMVDTGLSCEGLKTLVEALKENHTVTDLRWPVKNKCPVNWTQYVALSVIIMLTSFFFVRMAINKIGDVGAGHLAELLRINQTLRDIR